MSWKKLQLKSFKIFILKPKKYIITQQDTPHTTLLTTNNLTQDNMVYIQSEIRLELPGMKCKIN